MTTQVLSAMLLVPASLADVASIVTGLVTIALVCVTYVSVAVARDSAKAASVSADLAAKQLQEAQRPVLIPGDPRQEDDDLVIPVTNIGIGPGLRVFAVAQFRNQPANVIGRFPEHVLPGVAAGGDVALRLRMRLEDLVQLKITYADVGDHSYTTEASWHRRLGRFTQTVVTEGDGVRVPVTIRITGRTGATAGPLGPPPARLALRAWLSLNPRRSRPDQAILATWLGRIRARQPPDRHP